MKRKRKALRLGIIVPLRVDMMLRAFREARRKARKVLREIMDRGLMDKEGNSRMSGSMRSHSGPAKAGIGTLTLSALGVVFGDIGTSPLYALRECFAEALGLQVNHDNVLGVLSLVLWTMILVVCIKYLVYILRADNKGEGGVLSLMALVLHTFQGDEKPYLKKTFLALGLFGAAFLVGDGMITPAISVLSAVEGLSVATPVFDKWVLPITVFILNGLFLMQRFGTAQIGRIFGPVIFIWFTVLGALGIHGMLTNPEVLLAVSPLYAIQFFQANGTVGFLILGAVFLVATGTEALYADMGHFGRRPIRWAWFTVAMPGLLLNYFGQGALLLSDPSAISNPFYLLAPKWALIPMVVLSTIATVIASQALISGVFSISRQAVQLGFWPRLNIIHTSSREIGQIYVPAMNWTLFAGVIWLVLTFQTSSHLAHLYGLAVAMTMLITTILAFAVARRVWKWSWFKTITIFGSFVLIDLAFLGANSVKVMKGGWVPILIAIVIYVLMRTWQDGRRYLYGRLKERSMSVESFCRQILRKPPLRVPGTAIYMSGDPWGVPVPLLHNLKHNKVLHERVALLTIVTKDVPFVEGQDRVEIQEVTPNFYRILASYGFMETPKMKHILEACRAQDIHFNVQETTFVLGRETILPSSLPAMSLWREKLFALMSKNAQRPTAFFKIPPNQVIEVGIQVEI